MKVNDILFHRLRNQQIAGTVFNTPADLTSWLCGIQAQDYAQAKWSIGLRLPGCRDESVERAIASRTIIRSWLFRGTLHLVAAKDIYWLLDLLSAKIIQSALTRNKQLGLDEALFTKCNRILARALKNNTQLTRDELILILQRCGITVDGLRLSYLLHRAATSKLICLGTKRNNQFTYALLGDCVPQSQSLSREEALYELALRYFRSHGPATLQDFAWWSGLTLTEAKSGLASAKPMLLNEKTGEETFWFAENNHLSISPSGKMHLLAGFDEYVLGYKNRSMFVPPDFAKQVMTNNGIFNPVIVFNAQIIGTWKRSLHKNKVIIKTNLFKPLPVVHQKNMITEMKQFSKYLEKPLLM